jgi:hypothetical protein
MFGHVEKLGTQMRIPFGNGGVDARGIDRHRDG